MIWKDFWELPDRIFESDGPSWMSQFLSKLSFQWVEKDVPEVLSFWKMTLIVLDIKLTHLTTHFFKFPNLIFWQNFEFLEIFVILEGFWKGILGFFKGEQIF